MLRSLLPVLTRSPELGVAKVAVFLYAAVFLAVVAYFLMGLFEWRIGSPRGARMSWFQGLLIFSGLIAFARPSSGLLVPLRVIVGLIVACAGGVLINRYCREHRHGGSDPRDLSSRKGPHGGRRERR
jgi:hypothetical protein